MDSLVNSSNQNDRLYFLLLELFMWLKTRFSPKASCPACLSRYGAQTMHVPTSDCEIHVDKRRVIHIRDLVLAEGDWLVDTVEACDMLGISRVTLGVRRREGLLTKVEIGKKGGGVRYIASEIREMRQWYSVPKGKV
ncbi:MerR family transcriptional regulator [Sphingobacterium faecale]|uniref:Helix-turn-helix domain-containing protein n=1 Tax=Sphingobacterium faecale TaxID=2803775 RepID=A0ABS1R6P0_9SPHI|nr:helix-turn-helix domain-containing protein [Sphingobacterium faecale]MBL1410371.1 helix-turn-helix domain-containing protein [Sphingobacterium faecale]